MDKTLRHEESIVPPAPSQPARLGSFIVASDLHIPWHNTEGILHMCRVATALGIDRLIIAGDLIHADTISKYLGVGKTVKLTDELIACGRVLQALSAVFTTIDILPGNHDQRIEKTLASMKDTAHGRTALELVASLLGADETNPEQIASSFLMHFYQSPGVTIHALPDLLLNDTWLIQHPGSVSRQAPTNERRMSAKFRKSIIQGHSHLWGLGFDDSGQDVAFNCGHLTRPEKWRYIRERPSTFPMPTPGYAVIYTTPSNPYGRLLPVALHSRMFDPLDLLER